MAEELTPELEAFWQSFPEDRRRVKDDGTKVLLIEYDPHSELGEMTPAEYVELFGFPNRTPQSS